MDRRIIPRDEWGARYRPGFGMRPVPVPRRVLHHSVTLAPDLVPPYDDDYAAVRQLEEIGQSRFGGGMSYTTLFTPSGLIFEGLPIAAVGSHTADLNSVAAGLCLVGNYDVDRPPPEMVRSVAWYLRHAAGRGWITAPTITDVHAEVYPTACPGRYGREIVDEVNRLAGSGVDLEEEDMQKDERDALFAALEKIDGIRNALALAEILQGSDDPDDVAHAGTLLKRLSLRSRGMRNAVGRAEVLSGGVHIGTMVYELWASAGLSGGDLADLADALRTRLGTDEAAKLGALLVKATAK